MLYRTRKSSCKRTGRSSKAPNLKVVLRNMLIGIFLIQGFDCNDLDGY